MKIAYFLNEFPSLSETFILNQITGLLDMGHEVDIFSRRQGKMQKVHNEVIRFDLLKHTTYLPPVPRNRVLRAIEGSFLIMRNLHVRPGHILNSLNFFRFGKEAVSLVTLFQTIPFLNKGPYDVIHCHFGQNGNLAVRLREVGVISGKIVTAFHGFDLTSHVQKQGPGTYKHLFEVGDLFLPISERWKNRLIELGCKRNKIRVHRMGIDLSSLKKFERRNSKKESVIILSVARLVEKKGINYGIEAVARLKNRLKELLYIIIGDGIMKDDLVQLIEKNHLQNNVKLLGWRTRNEIFNIMNNTDIFLAPSVTSRTGSQEGIPVVLMEAMAHRLPVVASRHSGIPEIVIDGQNGFLVDERDVAGLADKIECLIANPEACHRMGEEGRRLVEKHYDIAKLNQKLAQIFIKIIDHSLN